MFLTFYLHKFFIYTMISKGQDHVFPLVALGLENLLSFFGDGLVFFLTLLETMLFWLFGVFIWLAMSSRKARKPSWACEASLRARERMHARYWSVERRWPPGLPEHTCLNQKWTKNLPPGFYFARPADN